MKQAENNGRRGARPPFGCVPSCRRLLGEYLLGDGHRGEGLGPARVEGQVCDGLDEFGLGEAVLLGQGEVVAELFGVPAGGEGRDREQAAFLRGELGAGPDLAEQDVVRQTHQLGGELAELLLSSGGLRLVVHHVSFSLGGVGTAVIGGRAAKWQPWRDRPSWARRSWGRSARTWCGSRGRGPRVAGPRAG